MRRLRWSLGFMIAAILIMIVDLLWHSPLTMTLFLSAGFGCAGIAILLFVLDVRENLRIRVTIADGGDRD